MIKDILTEAAVPHNQGRHPSPPAETYATYFDNVRGEGADPVGVKTPRLYHHDVRVELYEPKPDAEKEAAVEAALDARGLEWVKQDAHWLQDTQRYQVIYEFSYTSKNR